MLTEKAGSLFFALFCFVFYCFIYGQYQKFVFDALIILYGWAIASLVFTSLVYCLRGSQARIFFALSVRNLSNFAIVYAFNFPSVYTKHQVSRSLCSVIESIALVN